jgi:hypothetical protein
MPSHSSRRKSDTPAKAVMGIASVDAGMDGNRIRWRKGDGTNGWRAIAGWR